MIISISYKMIKIITIFTLFNYSIAWKNNFSKKKIITKPFPNNNNNLCIRNRIIKKQGKNKTILDIGCGYGFSTSERPGSLGIDTDRNKIDIANKLFPNKNFRLGVISSWQQYKFNIKYDIVTCMFYLHKLPQYRRKDIIQTAINHANERVIIIDYIRDFDLDSNTILLTPENIQFSEFLKNYPQDLSNFKEYVLRKNKIHMWILNIDKKKDNENKNKVIFDEILLKVLQFYRPI